MSIRARCIDQCRRLLACGPETTRDLSLHVGASRALVAAWLHGEPGISREGDVWALDQSGKWQERQEAREHQAAKDANGRLAGAVLWLSTNPGWHRYDQIADAAKLSYAAVAVSLKRHQTELNWSHDDRHRVLVAWKGAVCPAN